MRLKGAASRRMSAGSPVAITAVSKRGGDDEGVNQRLVGRRRRQGLAVLGSTAADD